jgi:hypothetical protein
MNLKLNLSTETLKDLGKRLVALTPVLTLVGIAAILTYTAIQIRNVLVLEPKPALVAAERKKIEDSKVKFDVKTLDSVNNSVEVDAHTDLGSLGKSDPFSP